MNFIEIISVAAFHILRPKLSLKHELAAINSRKNPFNSASAFEPLGDVRQVTQPFRLSILVMKGLDCMWSLPALMFGCVTL